MRTATSGYLSDSEEAEQPAGFPYNTPPSSWQGSAALPQSARNNLLTLVWISSDDCSTTPLARSYGGYPWEGVRLKDYKLLVHPACTAEEGTMSSKCTLTVPAEYAGGAFRIDSFTRGTNVTEAESTSRLLLQATFGPVKAEIDSILANSYGRAAGSAAEPADDTNVTAAAQWIENQITEEPTYLRLWYRRHTNPRLHPGGDYYYGRPYEVCEVGSRWHAYAFDWFDRGKVIVMKAAAHGVFQLFVDEVLRTEVTTFMGHDWAVDHAEMPFFLCSVGESLTWGDDGLTAEDATNQDGLAKRCNLAGGKINSGGTGYYHSANPPVKFETPIAANTQTFQSGEVTLGNVKTFKKFTGDFYMKSISGTATCSTALMLGGCSFIGIPDPDTGDLTYYKYQARLKFVKNTVDEPAIVNPHAPGSAGACPVVKKTFINENTCVQRTNGFCTPLEYEHGTLLTLNPETLVKFYASSHKYTYVVQGLGKGGTHTNIGPCKYSRSYPYSRFIRSAGSCPSPAAVAVDGSSKEVILAALKAYVKGENETPDIRDVKPWEHDPNGVCDQSTNIYGCSVELDGDCWTHHHQHEQNVYDFSVWVHQHSGNNDVRIAKHRNPIARFAQEGKHYITFPDYHRMSRWDSTMHNKAGWVRYLFYIGRYGDTVDFADLEDNLQTANMAKAVGATKIEHDAVFEACGSRGEVQNDPSLGNSYLGMTYTKQEEQGLDRLYFIWDSGYQSLWQNTAFRAPDQLRHRVAWALSQILVATPGHQTSIEDFAVFYDIFVGNAFGSYRTIIREIAQSALMGQYLTFSGNKKQAGGVYPDENFAREVMQLFTIGLVELNLDGTQKRDPKTGGTILTYSNNDIMAFARIWTGYSQQRAATGGATRGNIQAPLDFRSQNQVDPMGLNARDRDYFPKTSLNHNGYLGDGYPLCAELPQRAFLQKGSRYHRTGSHSELFSDRSHFVDDKNHASYDRIRKHLTPDPTTSKLYEAICAAGSGGVCTFPVDVYLPSTVACAGKAECGADILHVVKMVGSDGTVVYYNYIEPLCVDLQFFKNGHTVEYPNGNDQCADPKLPARSGNMCCVKQAFEQPCSDGSSNRAVTCPEDATEKAAMQPKYVASGHAIRESPGHSKNYGRPTIIITVEATVTAKFGMGDKRDTAGRFILSNGRGGTVLLDAVLLWAWGGVYIFVFPVAGVTIDYMNSVISKGDTLTFEYAEGAVGTIDVAKAARGGDQCLYLAETMTLATAAARCASVVDGGVVCPTRSRLTSNEDGSSPDWLDTCAGFQQTWTSTLCSNKVQIFDQGFVAVVDEGKDEGMGYINGLSRTGLGLHSGNGFDARWMGTHQHLYPDPNANCGETADPGYVKAASNAQCRNGGYKSKSLGHLSSVNLCAQGCVADGFDWFTYGQADTAHCDEAEGGCMCTCQWTDHAKDRCYFNKRTGVDLYQHKPMCTYAPATDSHAHSCICDVSVEESPVYVDATKPPPAAKALRAALHIAAAPPMHFAVGVYTRCTTAACNAQDGVRVYTKSSNSSPTAFDADTVFEITAVKAGKLGPRWSKYLLNRASTVYVGGARNSSDGGGRYSFRNAPTFNPSSGVAGVGSNHPYSSEAFLNQRAKYETTALIDHLIAHDNTAPFIAIRLIQRLTTSNPSPRYVEAVATAFRDGTYNGKTFSGEYGDLGAAVTAILLDREARTSILDADPTHGQIREPLLKVMHMMKSMEFQTENDMEFLMRHMHTKIGMSAAMQPSVFSFYTPDYSPDGHISDAGLVSPESKLLTMPWNVGYLNGMTSLINNGLAKEEDNGFGDRMNEAEGAIQGVLTFKPSKPNVPSAAVDELALLLTPGRLSEKNRRTIVAAYALKLEINSARLDTSSGMVATQNDGNNGDTGNGAMTAIRGAKGPQFNSNDCQRTRSLENEADAWWQLDFGKELHVKDVFIFPNGHSHEKYRHGISIYVDGVLCNENVKTSSSETPLPCNKKGRVLRFVKTHGPMVTIGSNRYKEMVLCEVELTFRRSPQPNIKPDTYDPDPRSEANALKHAQKLFSIVPEYHATNLYRPSDTVREVPETQPTFERPFKSVVTLFLAGGMDSFNVVVPYSDCTKPKEGGADGEIEAHDLYQEYVDVRGSTLAIPRSKLLPVTVPDANNQPCKRFGINNQLPLLHELYEAGDLAIIANQGSLIEPLTKAEFADIRTNGKMQPAGNFGHGGMYDNLETCEADDNTAHGILGKMVKNVMSLQKPMKSTLYSLNGDAKMVSGAPMRATHLDSAGVIRVRDLPALHTDIANLTSYEGASYFAEQWAGTVANTIRVTEDLSDKMADTLATTFPMTFGAAGGIGQQLQQVAKAMRMDVNLGKVERAAYHTSTLGWDTHRSVDYTNLFKGLNDGLRAFVTEVKAQGLWNNVTIIVLSEFGRTLTSNSRGTDHGWGGQNFVMGGGIKGKQMLGKFPTRLSELHSEEDAGRGRFIPTTPFESMWNAVAEWWDIPANERKAILPLMKNFNQSTLFSRSQLYEE